MPRLRRFVAVLRQLTATRIRVALMFSFLAPAMMPTARLWAQHCSPQIRDPECAPLHSPQ